MTFSLQTVARVAAFAAALAVAGTALALPGPQDASPPPPPGEEPQPPPPPPPPPDQSQPPTGAPPAEYKSDQTTAWGTTPGQETPPPTAQPDQPDPAKEALKKKCDELKKKGEPPTEECKSLELDIVFQGGIPTKQGIDRTKPQAKDNEAAPLMTETTDIQAVITDDEGNVDVWEVARREPVLFASERYNYLSAGVLVGYSVMFGRGSTVDKAYQPVIHVGAEGAYQVFRLFQIALAFDFEYLKGLSATASELRPTSFYPEETYPAGTERPAREVGAVLDDYWAIGLRPTFRLTLHFLENRVQTFLGAGFGWHFFKTSGRWRTKLPPEDPANAASVESDKAQWQGTDVARYKFDEWDSGLYSVLELALLYRWLDTRLGTGFVMQYTVPIHGGIEPDVDVQQSYAVTDDLGNPLPGYSAQKNDYGDSFIRHLSSLSFLTFNLLVDFRF